MGNTSTSVLTSRALNRALLGRQGLLERADRSVEETVAWLVGMQAQTPQSPYISLWSRLEPFDPEHVSRLLEERRLVRMAVMRTTIHLLTADDALRMRPLTQPLSARTWGSSSFARDLAGVDLDAVLARSQALLEAEPMTPSQLGARLLEDWPDRPGGSLAMASRFLLPLVQLPPRALWRRSGRAAHTTVESWLAREMVATPSIDAVVLRYLAAFGPATASDVRAWSGITGLREVVDRLRPQLRVFRDERGRELFDVVDGLLPDADTPAPVRFLPDFDNVLLGHDDRSRVVSDEDRRRVFASWPESFGSVLVDGFGVATWRHVREAEADVLRVLPLCALTPDEKTEIDAEGRRLIAFLVDAPREVRVEILPAR